MALSDEERRRIQNLEQELAETDPGLDHQLQEGMSRRWTSARTVYGILASLAGFALVIAGIINQLAVIGVAGFLLMVSGARCLPGHFPDGVTRQPPQRRADGGP
ncbi:DUF3040 domain-containing protein [Pseudarthrobacter sp. H3Y2-7]|uniref:DUF3040 domain-containing protein n=1 Tax=Pseudarthrobacter naphthalenicus TaxID=3031328 RepID=UPI0023B03A59|nr:DUF3040 domain-containing protein [Pseudarthrobacter sp. H3Y2-7]MDE8669949.1 DUF3040 domain-containing protein [Pseudarthrobacter sp. H3Y2-7]